MVEREGVLESVGGDVPMRPRPADVVDQHIQSRVRLEDLGGQSAHLGLGGHVRDEHVHRGVAALPSDVRRGCLGSPAVPAGDADSRTQGSQRGGSRHADAAGAAGDEDHLAGHRLRHGHADETKERLALKLVAITFFVLAAHVSVEGIRSLIGGEAPDRSAVGIVLLAISVGVMPLLAGAKRRVGEQLGTIR